MVVDLIVCLTSCFAEAFVAQLTEVKRPNLGIIKLYPLLVFCFEPLLCVDLRVFVPVDVDVADVVTGVCCAHMYYDAN